MEIKSIFRIMVAFGLIATIVFPGVCLAQEITSTIIDLSGNLLNLTKVNTAPLFFRAEDRDLGISIVELSNVKSFGRGDVFKGILVSSEILKGSQTKKITEKCELGVYSVEPSKAAGIFFERGQRTIKMAQMVERLCEPGASRTCTCPGGAEGSQQCFSDGSGFGSCVCNPMDDMRTLHAALRGQFGPEKRHKAQESAVAVLTGYLRHPEPEVRRQAASRFKFLHGFGVTKTASVAEVLVNACLEDPNRFVREQAAEALPQFAKEPEIEKLLQAAESGNQEAKSRAVFTLVRIQPKNDRVVPFLVSWLGKESYGEGRRAAYALAKVGKAAVPALKSVLAGDDPSAVRYAALSLGLIGKDAKDAVDDLVQVIEKQTRPEVRQWSAWALVRMGEKLSAALPLVIQAVESSPDSSQFQDVLRELGPKAAQAVEVIVKVVQKDAAAWQNGMEFERGPTSAEVLLKLGLKGRRALVKLINGSDKAERDFAVWAISEHHIVPSTALPGLLRVLDGPPPWLQTYAAQAIGKIGPAAAPAVPGLMQALKSPEIDLIREAARSLGKSGCTARASKEVLSKLAEEMDTKAKAREISAHRRSLYNDAAAIAREALKQVSCE